MFEDVTKGSRPRHRRVTCAETASQVAPTSVPGAVIPLPDGAAGRTTPGFYDVNPGKFGQVDNYNTLARKFGEQYEHWNGVDVTVNVRTRNGLTLQGGTSTGQNVADNCAVRANLPELNTAIGPGLVTSTVSTLSPYCHAAYGWLTQLRGLASYTVPKIDVQLSGTWRINPGTSLAANWIVSNAVIAAGPQPLGRPLSEANTVTVNLIQPQTVFSPTRHSYDMRIGKNLRFGRTRTQIGLDIFNLTNNDEITTFNQTFNPATQTYLNAQGITPARYARFNVQFDF